MADRRISKPHFVSSQLDWLARRIGTATRLAQKHICKQVGKAEAELSVGSLFRRADLLTTQVAALAQRLVAVDEQPGFEGKLPCSDSEGGQCRPSPRLEALTPGCEASVNSLGSDDSDLPPESSCSVGNKLKES